MRKRAKRVNRNTRDVVEIRGMVCHVLKGKCWKLALAAGDLLHPYSHPSQMLGDSLRRQVTVPRRCGYYGLNSPSTSGSRLC